MIRFVAFLFASILILEISATPAPNSSNNKKNYDVASPRTVNEFRSFALPSAEITAVVNLVTTFILLAVVATILMPILSGNVVLVQRRLDDQYYDALTSSTETDYNTLEDTEDVNNDNINLAGGYYNYAPSDPNNYYNYNYDPYGYVYDSNPTNTLQSRKLMTFGDPSFYFGDWVDSASDFMSKATDSMKSLDLVDTTFGLINVDSEVCRERAICEMERTASQNSITGFIAKSLSSYINGFDKYEGAIDRGLNGQNCEEIYAQCPYSLADKWKLFRRR